MRHRDETYDQALQQIAALPEEQLDLAREVLMWVAIMSPPRSLTMKDLLYLLRIAPTSNELRENSWITAEWIISSCCGLVTVDGGDGAVKFERM